MDRSHTARPCGRIRTDGDNLAAVEHFDRRRGRISHTLIIRRPEAGRAEAWRRWSGRRRTHRPHRHGGIKDARPVRVKREMSMMGDVRSEATSQSREIRGPGRCCLHSLTYNQPALAPNGGGPPGLRRRSPAGPAVAGESGGPPRRPKGFRQVHEGNTVPHYELLVVPFSGEWAA